MKCSCSKKWILWGWVKLNCYFWFCLIVSNQWQLASKPASFCELLKKVFWARGEFCSLPFWLLEAKAGNHQNCECNWDPFIKPSEGYITFCNTLKEWVRALSNSLFRSTAQGTILGRDRSNCTTVEDNLDNLSCLLSVMIVLTSPVCLPVWSLQVRCRRKR